MKLDEGFRLDGLLGLSLNPEPVEFGQKNAGFQPTIFVHTYSLGE
jgi:hypothetical protein